MQIEVNGQTKEVAAGTRISDLLSALGYSGQPVAVERNREIVPRAEHTLALVQPGDQIEIVEFVGGG